MAKSSRENEIKLAFPSPDVAIRRLLEAGAIGLREREFEDNVLFDRATGELARSGRLIRLRVSGATALLTYKEPAAGEHRHKVKVERETEVADPKAMRAILLGLGLEPVYRYQKFRATYRLGDVEAAVDETPLGTFVELEGSPDDIDRAAAALGASPGDFIRETYRDLQERDAASRGTIAGDLLMPRPGTHDRS